MKMKTPTKWKIVKAAFASAVLMLPALSSLGQVTSVTPCVWTPTNDLCANAIALTVGPECTPGNVAGAGSVGDDTVTTGCWASVRDQGIWYTVNLTAGSTYIISTDNGGLFTDFDNDMQLALYSGTCGSLTEVACNDDAGECNTLAAVIKYTATVTGTYYIQVDRYDVPVTDPALGHFCINVTEDVVSSNNCPNAAIDITDFMDNTLTACNPFESKAYTYYYATPSTVQNIVDGACNSVDPAISGTFHDVWFKYTVTAASNSKWLNVFSNNDCIYYGLAAYRENGSPATATCDLDGVVNWGSSLGDLNPLSCGCTSSKDRAKGSAMNHPRLDLTGLTVGETIWVRVYQYTRVLIDTNNTAQAAPASNGIFNLVTEAAPILNGPGDADDTSIDGLTRDRCITGNPTIGCNADCSNPVPLAASADDQHISLNCLTNAGLRGNVWSGSACPANGCSTSARSDEPLQLTTNPAVLNGEYEHNCDGNTFTFVDGCKNPNLSGFYKFSIEAVEVKIPCLLFNEELPEFALLCSLVSLLPPPLNAILGGLLCTPATCLAPPSPLSTVTVPALGQVEARLSNIRTAGVNGGQLRAYAYPAAGNDCQNSEPIVMHAYPNSCDSSVCFRPVSANCNALPPGCYTLVIDGENAQLLSYDLDIDITYIDPIACLPVGLGDCTDNSREGRPTELAKVEGIQLQSVRPVPSRDKVEVAYIAGTEGTMTVEVYSLIGQKVYSGSFSTSIGENVQQINISSLKPGVYLLNMEQNGVKLQSRIVKVD